MNIRSFSLAITLSIAFAVPGFAFKTIDALHPQTYETEEQVWRMQIEIAAERRKKQ